MNHKGTRIGKDGEDPRFQSSPTLSQAAGLQLIGLGAMQIVMITLLLSFKDILCLSKKGKQQNTGLVLQKGAVCGVAVKEIGYEAAC